MSAPTAAGKPRSGRLRRRASAAALGVFLALAAGEVVVRIEVGAPLPERLPILNIQANPHRGWQMVPSESHHTYYHSVTINSYGLRGAEIDTKAPGEVRVLALGDSLIYGQGVGDDQTVPFYMESELTAGAGPETSYRVINAGHRAYATNQELGLLRELGPRLEPDVVVLFWYWNDFQEPDIQANFERFQRKGVVTFDTKQPMVGRARLKWQALQLVRRSALFMYLYDQKDRFTESSPVADSHLIAEGLHRLEQHLDDFLELSETLGFRPVLAIIPDANELKGFHPSEVIAADVAQLAEARQLPVLRLLEPLRAFVQETGTLPIIPYDWHYDEVGNRELAAAVVAGLRRVGAL